MDKQDTPEYALHQLKCLITAHKKHYDKDALDILGMLQDAVSEGQWELDREDGGDIDNSEHRQGAMELGVGRYR